MNELKVGRLIVGIDLNAYLYCLGAGKQNRGSKIKNSVNKMKLHKRKKVKIKEKEKDKQWMPGKH